MENKYYTPEIEEFHIGFEFEEKPLYFSEFGDYMPQSIHVGGSSAESHLKNSWVRVKYLDSEDIESLGFFKWPDDDIYDLGEFQLHLGRYDDPYKVEIYDDNSKYCFVGVIKNKSELKKVLKMIGYE